MLGRHLTNDVRRLLREAEKSELWDAARAEAVLLEVHHGEIGALIAQHWNLPAGIVRGVQFHHAPESEPDPVADFVHVANTLAHDVADTNHEPPADGALARLGLKPERFEPLAEALRARIDAHLASYA